MTFDCMAECMDGIEINSVMFVNDQRREIIKSEPNDNPLLTTIDKTKYQLDQNKKIGLVCNYAECCLGNIGEKLRNALKTNWLAQDIINKELKYFPENKPFFYDYFKEESTKLPSSHSILIEIHFNLNTPWHSSEEDGFGPIENMCTRDSMTGKPCVRSSSWKGNLRAFFENEVPEDKKDRIIKLFGSEKEKTTETSAIAGRLKFYQTVFETTRGEVLSPHDRISRTSKNIVLFETVPVNSKGKLNILYFPFDIYEKNIEEKRDIIKGDIALLLKNMESFLSNYGFSAKESIGWGLSDLNSLKIYPGTSIKLSESNDIKKIVEINGNITDQKPIADIIQNLPEDTKDALKKYNWHEAFSNNDVQDNETAIGLLGGYLGNPDRLNLSPRSIKKKFRRNGDVALRLYNCVKEEPFKNWLTKLKTQLDNTQSCFEITDFTNIENIINENMEVV